VGMGEEKRSVRKTNFFVIVNVGTQRFGYIICHHKKVRESELCSKCLPERVHASSGDGRRGP
jgi:hypothetical protein